MPIELKPGDESSCFNNDGLGADSVATLTRDTFDPVTINPFSVTLDGAGVRVKGKSGHPDSLEDVKPRGTADLVAQIEDEDGIYLEGDIVATLIGATFVGTPFQGTATVC